MINVEVNAQVYNWGLLSHLICTEYTHAALSLSFSDNSDGKGTWAERSVAPPSGGGGEHPGRGGGVDEAVLVGDPREPTLLQSGQPIPQKTH